MTEEEAKTKWCPFARVATCESVAWNRAASGARNEASLTVEPAALCIGSACMAWREQAPPREKVRNYHDAPEVNGRWVGSTRVFEGGWQYEHTDIDQSGRKFDLLHRPAPDGVRAGYCGLAGAPQP